MNRLLAWAALLLAAAAAAFAAAAWNEARTVREEVRVREETRAAPAPSAATPGATGDSPTLPPGGGAPTPPIDSGPPAAAGEGRTAQVAPALEQAVRTLVRQAVAEEFEARRAAAAAAGEGTGEPAKPAPEAKAGEEKKPPLSQVAAVLGLAESQRDGMREAVLAGQREVIDMLRRPMADGKVPLDEIFDVFLDEPEKAKARAPALFGMLLTEKISGTDETYGAHWEGLKKRAVETFARDLTPEQFREYEKMGLDPLEIQVPGSPWVEVLQEAFQRRRR